MVALLAESLAPVVSGPDPWMSLVVSLAALVAACAAAVPQLVTWYTRKPEVAVAISKTEKPDSGKTARIVADQLRRAGLPVPSSTPTEGERLASLESWRRDIDAWRKDLDARENKLLERSERIVELLEKQESKEREKPALARKGG